MKTLTLICLLVVLCQSLYMFSSSSHAATPQVWEYKVIFKKCNDEKNLNVIGADGWELATYAVFPAGLSSVDTCVFKRAK